MTLKSYNKMGFIDGTLAKPEKTDSDFAAWSMINNMLVSWIYNSLDSSIKITMSRITDARTMWEALKTHYSVPNVSQGFKLWTDLSSTRQHGSSVMVY